jgi:hypothetical protein
MQKNNTKMETLCKKCILPKDYAGAIFNEQGICDFCRDYKPPQYLGESKLKEDILHILKDKKSDKYDCIIGLSGGRDSTYLLWYIVNILKLRPLAVFVDSKLIPNETLSNINKTVAILKVDLIVKKHELLLKSVKHFLKSWPNYPSPASLISLCTGCRLGLCKLINEEALNRNIPIVLTGGTPFEQGLFKTNLISPKKNRKIPFILGYGKQIFRNPSLISNLSCLKVQIDEYFNVLWRFKKPKLVYIAPFNNYIRWEEKKIEEILKNELDWKRYPGLESSYRGDCEIGIIRQFLYDKMLGYNDKDDHLSWLIRDNQISRNEGLDRIKREKETKLDILKSSFDKFGIDFLEYINKVERNARKYNIVYKP